MLLEVKEFDGECKYKLEDSIEIYQNSSINFNYGVFVVEIRMQVILYIGVGEIWGFEGCSNIIKL